MIIIVIIYKEDWGPEQLSICQRPKVNKDNF